MTPRMPEKSRVRRGLTLIEVLLALAILAIAMGAVAQLMAIGARAADAAETTATAQLVAESKMNELASGAAPLEPTGLTPYEAAEGWEYSIEVTPIEEPAGLASVKVFVRQVTENDDPLTFELYRWMPAEGFLELPTPEEASASGSAPGAQSLPGSSSGGSSMGGGSGFGSAPPSAGGSR